MTLGELIVAYRKEHDISMREFARRANLSATYVSALEKNATFRGNAPKLSLDTYKAVAGAMGKTLDEVIRTVNGDDTVSLNSDVDDLDLQLFAAGVTEDNIDDIFMELASRLDRQALLELAQKLIALASTK